MLSILASLLGLHAAVLPRCKCERERCDAHASEKKYENQVQSVSKREGKFGVGWWWQVDNKRGTGKIPNKLKKRIQRNERRDSKQDIKKNSESETAGKHMGK